MKCHLLALLFVILCSASFIEGRTITDDKDSSSLPILSVHLVPHTHDDVGELLHGSVYVCVYVCMCVCVL